MDIPQIETRSLEAPGTRLLISTPPAKTRSRLFFVDHLRVFLTTLVVIHHLAATYSGVPLWYYTETTDDAASSGLLSLLLLINQSFFMGLFFLISAYFVPGSVDRKGVGAFLSDRFRRLLVPLGIFYFIVGPATALGIAIYRGAGLPSFQAYLDSLGFGPLWFVELLLVFTILYALWRLLTRERPLPSTTVRYGPPFYGLVTVFTLSLATVTFLWRTLVPVGLWIPVIDFPTLAYLPQYASFFVVGIIAYHRDWFRSIPASMGNVGFAMALGATVLFFPPALAGIPASFGGGSWQSIWYALWDSTFCVGISLSLLTFFRKHGDVQRPLGRFLSTHAYAVYVLHAPVVVAVALALAGLEYDPLLRFGVAAVIGVPLCFALAWLVRKLPFASKVL